MLLRCLGLKPDIEQVKKISDEKILFLGRVIKAKTMASQVSVDVTGFSVSFNEYLRLISIQRRAEPDEDKLMEVFRH